MCKTRNEQDAAKTECSLTENFHKTTKGKILIRTLENVFIFFDKLQTKDGNLKKTELVGAAHTLDIKN
jgi:hypothetical protein